MLEVVLPEKSYEIVIKRNSLEQISEWIGGLWGNKKLLSSAIQMYFRFMENRFKTIGSNL